MADNPLIKDVPIFESITTVGSEIEKRIKKIFDTQADTHDPITYVKKLSIEPFRISTDIALIDKPVIQACQISSAITFVVTSSKISPEGLVHTQSEWKASLSSDMSNPIAELTSPTLLTEALITTGVIGYETTYYFAVRYHSGDIVSKWSDPMSITTAAPAPIGTPSITTYAKTADVDSFDLAASPFVHSVLSHTRTVWEVSLNSNFSTILTTLDTTTALTSANIPVTNLQDDTDYYFRVRYYSGKYASAWSPVVVVRTPISSFINAPSITVPSLVCSYNFEAESSSFDPSDPIMPHTSTTWELSTDGAFGAGTIVFNAVQTDDLRHVTIPENICASNTDYYLRAKYHSDTVVSPWSPIVKVTTGYTYSAKAKQQVLPNITTIVGDTGIYIPVKVGANLYGVYQTKYNKIGISKYDPDTQGWIEIVVTNIKFDADINLCGDNTSIYILSGREISVFSVYKFNTLDNTYSALTTIPKTIPDANGIKSVFAKGSGFAFFDTLLWFINAGRVISINPSTGVQIPVSSDGKVEGTSLPSGFLTDTSIAICVDDYTFMYIAMEGANKTQVWTYTPPSPNQIYDGNVWTKKNDLPANPSVCANLNMEMTTWVNYKLTTGLSGPILIQRVTDTANSLVYYSFIRYVKDTDGWSDILILTRKLGESSIYFDAIADDIFAVANEFGKTFRPEVTSASAYASSENIMDRSFAMQACSFVLEDRIYDVVVSNSMHPKASFFGTDAFTITSVDPVTWKKNDIHLLFHPTLVKVGSDGTALTYANGYVYFCGGVSVTDEGTNYRCNNVWRVDAITGEIELFDATGPVCHNSSIFVYDNKLYCIGGHGEKDDAYLKPRYLDLTTKVWTLSDVNVPELNREGARIVPTSSGAFIFGGMSTALDESGLGNIYLMNLTDYSVVDKGVIPDVGGPLLFSMEDDCYCLPDKTLIANTPPLLIYKYNKISGAFEVSNTVTLPSVSVNSETTALTWEDCYVTSDGLIAVASVDEAYVNTLISKVALFKINLTTNIATLIFGGRYNEIVSISGTEIMTSDGKDDGFEAEAIIRFTHEYIGPWNSLKTLKLTPSMVGGSVVGPSVYTKDIFEEFGPADPDLLNFAFYTPCAVIMRYRTATCGWSEWSKPYSFTFRSME